MNAMRRNLRIGIGVADLGCLWDAARDFPAPDVVVVDEEEFNKRGAEHKANRQRSNRIRRLFNKSSQ